MVCEKPTKGFILANIEDVRPHSHAMKKWLFLLLTRVGWTQMKEGTKEGHWAWNVYDTEMAR